MALLYTPGVGDIVYCEFPECFVAPEMVKRRPVVVISPSIAGRAGLVAVVPLSTTVPDPILEHHCEIPIRLLQRALQARSSVSWAKCDMLYTLSVDRLHAVQGARNRSTGQREYQRARLDLATIQAVRRCCASALGITPILWPNP